MQAHFKDVTGGLYKTKEHIHRSVLIYDYWRFLLHIFEFQKIICTKKNFIDLLQFTFCFLLFFFIVAHM
jgi:hypothetical protein